jgi:hypothetical protein
MTTYLDIFPLKGVKHFLKVDFCDFDDEIELYIKSACRLFEQRTQYNLAEVEISFNEGDRIYNFPINDNLNKLQNKGTYFVAKEDVTLNLGYQDPLEVPEDIKDCVIEIVKEKLRAKEADELPSYNGLIHDIINVRKRFYI